MADVDGWLSTALSVWCVCGDWRARDETSEWGERAIADDLADDATDAAGRGAIVID